MKNSFKQYYNPSESDFIRIWKNGLFVFDTNVLLNFYEYSEETLDQFIKLIESLANNDRIWIPYQVGLEFHHNKYNKIDNQIESYDEIKKVIEKFENKIESFSNQYSEHRQLNTNELKLLFSKPIEKSYVMINEAQDNHPNWYEEDNISIKIGELFTNRVGDEEDESKLKDIFEKGKLRYNKKIPPGYEDIKKEKMRQKYGDLIIWFNMIDKAKKEDKPIIFITNDQKEDWILKRNNKKLGPRPELRKEFFKKTNHEFYIYNSNKFLEYANKYLETNIDNHALKEVEEKLIETEAYVNRELSKYENNVDYFIVKNFHVKNLSNKNHDFIEEISLMKKEINEIISKLDIYTREQEMMVDPGTGDYYLKLKNGTISHKSCTQEYYDLDEKILNLKTILSNYKNLIFEYYYKLNYLISNGNKSIEYDIAKREIENLLADRFWDVE